MAKYEKRFSSTITDSERLDRLRFLAVGLGLRITGKSIESLEKEISEKKASTSGTMSAGLQK